MSRTVEIKGLTVTIDDKKAADWHTFSILRKARGADNLGQLDAMLEIIEYATDQTEESIVSHFGGEDAETAEIIGAVSEIIQAVTPKN